jgi:putative DNA primase/helicase
LSTSAPILVCMADVFPELVEWLWQYRLPLGKLVMNGGDPDLGKTMVACDIAARVSTGTPWPDGAPCAQGSVIILTAEDGIADTIAPRLQAAGADMTRVHVLKGILRVSDEGKTSEHMFTIADIEILRNALEQIGDVRLVIIDPVTAYCADADTHKTAEVRALLMPLSQLAEEYRVTVLMITHMNKSQGRAMYRATGSLAFVAAARAVFVFAKDKRDEDLRLMATLKSNLAKKPPTLAYRIIDGKVSWESGTVNISADEALKDDDTREEAPAKARAKEFLETMLADGPVESKRVQAEAKAAGLAWRTVRRAGDGLQVKVERDGFGREGVWTWRLPNVAKSNVANSHSMDTEDTFGKRWTPMDYVTAGSALVPNVAKSTNGDGHL